MTRKIIRDYTPRDKENVDVLRTCRENYNWKENCRHLARDTERFRVTKAIKGPTRFVTARKIHNKAQSRIIIKRRLRIREHLTKKECRVKASIVICICALTMYGYLLKEEGNYSGIINPAVISRKWSGKKFRNIATISIKDNGKNKQNMAQSYGENGTSCLPAGNIFSDS